MVLRLKPKKHRGDFEVQINKPHLPVLGPKPEIITLDFESKPRKLSPPVLRSNREKPSQWF
jgi:hypothetical protein